MRTEGIIWVGLGVRDVEAITASYREMLGMPVLERGAGYVHLDPGGGALLEVFTAPCESPEATGPPQQHSFEIALQVDDLDAAIDDLHAKGVPLSLRELGHYWDQRWIRVQDPEGNRLEIKEVRSQRVPTKSELVQALSTSAREALANLRTLAAIEWTLPRIVQLTVDGTLVEGRSSSPEEPSVSPEDYIARELERRRGSSAADLLAEFERNRQATVAAAEGLDGSLLRTVIRSAVTGPLGIGLYAIGVEHMLGQVGEVTGKDYLSWRLRNSPDV
jgi:catechol 2,3-dioxygenase-like lactoylglutathione lyase family enzyme